MWKMKTKRANVITYTRPSIKSIPANHYEISGQEHIVYPCIRGWFEIRRVDKDNIKTVEFIRKEDIRYSTEYLIFVMKEKARRLMRIKPLTIKFLRSAMVKSKR
ncbi:hypothetical protein [Bacillus sp. ISL-7]|uniref:hypothetical protein n=1 Tax=Bacillus sp. ISL-7 TaxID=2819136 RepID=UPI001BED2982|nr:hypothetical protein [Bacillus sp. ISL-7]MBT2734689.1 hypothetical protein [Bacillus sp. ISL-7]